MRFGRKHRRGVRRNLLCTALRSLVQGFDQFRRMDGLEDVVDRLQPDSLLEIGKIIITADDDELDGDFFSRT